jgi:hypothetical protein
LVNGSWRMKKSVGGMTSRMPSCIVEKSDAVSSGL